MLGLPKRTKQAALHYLQQQYRDAELTPDAPFLMDVSAQAMAYLAGELEQFAVTLDLRGHMSFELAVWAAVARIPFGQTRTYSWVADQGGGGRGAAQAAGAAAGDNPIRSSCRAIDIGSDGSLHGFAGGLEMKARLWRWKAARERSNSTPQAEEGFGAVFRPDDRHHLGSADRLQSVRRRGFDAMRIAVFGRHPQGNLFGVEAVLADLRAKAPTPCSSPAISSTSFRGAQRSSTILRTLPHQAVIGKRRTGPDALGHAVVAGTGWDLPLAQEVVEWERARLGPKRLAWLAALPEHAALSARKLEDLVVVHGVPGNPFLPFLPWPGEDRSPWVQTDTREPQEFR